MLLSVYHVVLKDVVRKNQLFCKLFMTFWCFYERDIVKIVQNRCFSKEMPNF